MFKLIILWNKKIREKIKYKDRVYRFYTNGKKDYNWVSEQGYSVLDQSRPDQ